MKFVSLFAGIGGLDLGLERAGHECVLQVESDPYCQRVLAKHWPDVRRIAEVRVVMHADCAGGDLMIGGFPCQPVSVAGKRLGVDDERWLWPEFARLVRVVRPRYVVVENVPGLLTGAGMSEVLGDLASCGYDAEWDCIPAAAVGAPHLRYRVFIVATRSAVPDASGGGVREQWERGRQQHEQSGTPVTLGDGAAGTMADANGSARRPAGRAGEALYGPEPLERSGRRSGVPPATVADTSSLRPSRSGQPVEPIDPTAGGSGEADRPLNDSFLDQWAVEPDVRGMVDGVPEGLDGSVDAGEGLGSEGGSAGSVASELSRLWEQVAASPPPSKRRSDGQLARELADAMRELPHAAALGDGQEAVATAQCYMHGLRQACEALGALRDSSEPLAAAWQSLPREAKDWAHVAACRGPWIREWPSVPRVASGVPARVDRLRALGNAVVPAVAEYIGRLLPLEVSPLF